ncbi:MAG TPA: S9 family peptidase [Saprospiraceae bacterium]|nr:S9 family peptidase [Saprospiraceae bacterium]
MSKIHYPKPDKINKELLMFDDLRIDPYYWLNERENPKVLDHLQKENEYTKQMLNDQQDLEKKIYEEIINRIPGNDESVPYFKNGYWYQSIFQEGKEYPVYTRYKTPDQKEILLDLNVLAEGHSYYHVATLSVSPDNQWLAYGEDTMSRRIYTIKIKNLLTGEMLTESIPNTDGVAVWADTNRHFFYAEKDDTLREYKIKRHQLHETADQDVEVFEESDESFYCHVGKTKSGKFILITSSSTLTTEYQFIRSDSPLESFTVFLPRERAHEYHIDHCQNQWLIRSNDQAKNFKCCIASEQQYSKLDWKELISHRSDVMIDDVELFNDFVAICERTDAMTRICIYNFLGDREEIAFQDEVYSASLGINPEPDARKLRVHCQSMKTPATTYDFELDQKQLKTLKVHSPKGQFNPDEYYTDRIYATAQDGTKIPISIVGRKEIQHKQSPLLLYGYGSYGICIDPSFSLSRISLLDRNWKFAIAHIRGGEENGKEWYENGKLLHKKNSFTDFIDCAQELIRLNLTDAQQLCAYGGSAGGLLLGAVANQAPELWKSMVVAVPFVDTLTTMLDDSIPLTTGEYDEWGNPNLKPYYDYIKSYSPYDNVKAQDYPSMLVTTGFHDSQVQYWEPAKWVARLREMNTSASTSILLHCNLETGHGGASGRYKTHLETAMIYAFLIRSVTLR